MERASDTFSETNLSSTSSFEHISADEADELSSFAHLSLGETSSDDDNFSFGDDYDEHLDASTAPLGATVTLPAAQADPYSATQPVPQADPYSDYADLARLASEAAVDPGQLLTSITQLIARIEHVVNAVGRLRGKRRAGAQLEGLSRVCHWLFRQLCELESIAASYGAAAEADGACEIDPGVLAWVRGVLWCLRGVGERLDAVVQEVLEREARMEELCEAYLRGEEVDEVSTIPDVDLEEEWKIYRIELEEYRARLDEFLPVLQADLGTYHTANMGIAVPSSTPGYTHPSIQTLRRELYRLKDIVTSLYSHIGDLDATNNTPHVSSLREQQPALSTLRTALTRYLSNHGSDWLDSLLAGGLSFSEFRALDLSYLKGVMQALVEWQEEMGWQVARSGGGGRSTVQEDIGWQAEHGGGGRSIVVNRAYRPLVEGEELFVGEVGYFQGILEELGRRLKVERMGE